MTTSRNPADEAHHQDGDADAQQAPLKVNTLEPRILLSATWVDAENAEEMVGPSDADDAAAGDTAGELLTGGPEDDALFGCLR